MRNAKRRLGVLMALSLIITCLAAPLGMSATTARAEEAKPTVWVVGDSTVSAFTDPYYYPRYGWGTQLDKYIDASYAIQNLAVSGTSSKSFTNDANYAKLTGENGMKSGDVLLIGFGHNDEKHEKDRYTSPSADYTADGTFANSLYTNYIKKAQDAGVQVVLCTPIVRRTATSGAWKDNDLHITKDETDTAGNNYVGGDYAKVIRDLGAALQIPVVDMTAMTKELYDSLGAEETANLHAWTSNKAGSVDNTHTNIWGGTYNAYLVCKAMKALNVPGIAAHITVGEAPAKAATLVSNPAYVSVDYTGELKQSDLWNDVGIWKGTALGNLGGAPTTTNFTLEETGQGDIHIAVKNNKGKIAAASDGIAMYYTKVPVGSTFTLSATMTVNSFDSNAQVAFGLMARDDMYIDENLSSLASDYVVAGVLDTVTPQNCYFRKDKVLTKGGNLTKETLKAGSSYEVKIQSNTDGYACTFGTEPTQSAGYDFALTTVDSDYVYVGMFVARNADVTFSNIKLDVQEPEKPGDSTPTDATPTDATYEDTTTRIVIDAPAGAFDKTVAFKAQAVTGKTTDGKYTFDLSFTDGNGNKVQPKEAVTVKIPVPAALSGKAIYVYHVEDDGKYTEMSSKIENGMVVFTASKFSEYVLSSEKLATNAPATGVASSGIWILALTSASVLLLALMGEAHMMKKKRR